MLGAPEVARWWGGYDAERVRREHLDPAETWVVVVDGTVAGILLADEEADPDFPSVAFDLALAPGLHGRGLGREALRTAIRHFVACGHHRFTIDPAADNAQAIRRYAAVGFRPVGILRAHERDPDGGWRDGLLMDLLAGDLR